MYSGIVLDISWERVFVTISGEMKEIGFLFGGKYREASIL